MKEKLRESSQLFGNSSLQSKSHRRRDEKEETLIGGSSMAAATLQSVQFFPWGCLSASSFLPFLLRAFGKRKKEKALIGKLELK